MRNSGTCLKAQQNKIYVSITVARGRQMTGSYLVIIYSVLHVLARGCDLSHSANAVWAGNHKFPLPP